jgi:hypothetical protein
MKQIPTYIQVQIECCKKNLKRLNNDISDITKDLTDLLYSDEDVKCIFFNSFYQFTDLDDAVTKLNEIRKLVNNYGLDEDDRL